MSHRTSLFGVGDENGHKSGGGRGRTARQDAGIRVELDGVYFAHVARQTTGRHPGRDVPDKDGPVSARRCKLGIVVAPGGRTESGQHSERQRVAWERTDVHGYGEDLVSMRLKGLDFGARVGVPEADGAVLATTEDVLCGALCVADDVDGAAMAAERRV